MMAKEREGMIKPGDVPWFPAEQFEGWLWGFEDAVWISFIESREPGNGNLSALMDAIWQSGRAVVVPTPFAKMEQIVIRKGFRPSICPETGAELWTREPPAKSTEAA